MAKLILGVCVLGVGTGSVIGQETIIDNSTEGYYNSDLGTLLDGTDSDRFPLANTFTGEELIFSTEPDLTAAAEVLGDWLATPVPALGDSWSDLQLIPTSWAVNTETAVVYEVDAGGGYSNLLATFLIDNGIHIWINDEFRYGARQPNPKWFFDVPLGSLAPGLNYIQVLREDSGGSTSYNMQISGDPAPLPGTQCEFASIDQEAKVFELAISNQRTGLSSISVTSTNAEVEVPLFDYGSTEPVIVVISKVDAAANAIAEFEIEDLNTETVPCDWADVVKLGSERLYLENLEPEQSLLAVHNGVPGFKKLHFTAGGETLSLDRLTDGMYLEDVDISQLLMDGDGSLEVRGFGPPDTSATLLLPSTEAGTP
jgi:hypothetical protein